MSLRAIRNFKDDSLYIHADNIDDFYTNYKDIFQGVDCCGINYFTPNQVDEIAIKLGVQKPLEYATLLEWLKQGEDYNGIYILGI